MDAAAASSSYALGMVEAYANYMTKPLTAPLGVGVMAGLSALYTLQLATIMATLSHWGNPTHLNMQRERFSQRGPKANCWGCRKTRSY